MILQKGWNNEEEKQVQSEDKRKRDCTVDCHKGIGNIIHSRPFACGLPSLLSFTVYRSVSVHGKKYIPPLYRKSSN